jgi:hypothetical protein
VVSSDLPGLAATCVSCLVSLICVVSLIFFLFQLEILRLCSLLQHRCALRLLAILMFNQLFCSNSPTAWISALSKSNSLRWSTRKAASTTSSPVFLPPLRQPHRQPVPLRLLLLTLFRRVQPRHRRSLAHRVPQARTMIPVEAVTLLLFLLHPSHLPRKTSK